MSARNQPQPASGNGAVDQPRVFVQNHVVRAGHHQHGHRQRAQLLRRQIRLLHHQGQKLVLCPRPTVKKGNEFRRPIPDLNGQLHRALHAARKQISTVQNQPLHPPGKPQRKDERDVRAVAEPQKMRPLNAVLVQKIPQIQRKLLQGKRRAAPWRTPVPARVHRNHPIIRRKRSDLMHKIGRILPVPVQQHQRKPLSSLLKEQPHIRQRKPSNPARKQKRNRFFQ